MSTFLATNIVPQIDLQLLRRDYFDGFSLLLQQADGTPYDLSSVQVCASVWKTTISGTTELLMNINIEEQEPLTAGRVRLWLSSSQTNTLWDALQYSVPSGTFFPTAYISQVRPALSWDIRIETQEQLASLVSVSSGTFISQTNHALGSTERVIFQSTAQSSINYNNTSARIYSSLSGITYIAPYSFTIASLSGITNAAIGGTVSRLKQDTVVGGNIVVGTTLSNCFP